MNKLLPFIPDDAPFTPDQRSWLNGFLAGLFSSVEAQIAAIAPTPTSMKVAVLYATQSGTSERLAKKLVKELKQQGHDAILASLDTYTPVELAEQKLALVIASTYGDGEPTVGAQAFFEALSLLSAPRLDNLRYGVLALGDPSYEHFCKFGADLDSRFYALGGTRLCERVDCGVDVDEPFQRWKNTLVHILNEPQEGTSPEAPSTITLVAPPLKSQIHTRDNPYLAEVVDKKPLTHEQSSKLTIHVGISLEGSDIHYEAGDACGVIAQNDPVVVAEILRLTGFASDAIVDLPKIGSTRLTDALAHHLQPTRLTRKMLTLYATISECKMLQRMLLPEEQLEFETYIYDRGIIDLLEECPGVLTSPAQLVNLLPKLTTRLYSISSSPSFHARELHATVAVVRYHSHNRARGGVCSTMLSDRTPLGTKLPIYIQPNKKFRLPDDGTAPIIMIGPGTGIAPFRSFLHERRARGSTGRNWLFFGDRSATTDFLYRNELEAMNIDGHLTRLDTAFSRDQEHKLYVQDRMIEAGAEFWRWLDDGASIYVCGDASRMAKDVDKALHKIVERHGNKDSEAAKDFVHNLQEQRRYHRDVY